jgi:murein DD-endopeptidase MepM/ murein hydrolase activator NlpD
VTNPVPGHGVSTPYGKHGSYWSCSPDANGNGIHTGTDHSAPAGTKVVAARPGTAVYSDHGSSFGYHQLDVRAGDGTRDFYAHMSKRTVANGAKVSAGQQVGVVGSEGNVTGPHLHFERHATETGGWSCSVVRDPAPSINYQSGGSGGGQDEDMPTYERVALTKDLKVKANAWTSLPWDTVHAGKAVAKGDTAVYADGPIVATLTVTATPTKGSDDVIRTRWLERSTEKGETVTNETWAAVEHKVTDGGTYLSDTRVQKIADSCVR